MTDASLEPLACASCGRPVPLGAGDVSRCTACDATVEIPERYRQLRDAAGLDDDARARAELISAELARPPSRAMLFWIAAAGIAMLFALLLLAVWILVSLVMCVVTFVDAGPFGAAIMLVVGLVLGVPLFWDQALHGLAGPLSVDLADRWGGAWEYGLLGAFVFVVTVVPVVLGAYADSFESVRTALRTALAASPAATPGAGEACRGCGGPLDVIADRLHARCVYCGADNLVHLDRATLAKLEGEMKVVARDLESAIAEETATAHRGRRHAAVRLVRSLALVPVCILLGRCVAAVNECDETFWYRAVPSAPMIPRNANNPLLERDVAAAFDVHDTFDSCDDHDCRAYYFVALEAGETPRLEVERGDLRLVAIARREVGHWYDPTYHWVDIELDGGVPYAGWYRVALATTKQRGPEPIVRWDTTR